MRIRKSRRTVICLALFILIFGLYTNNQRTDNLEICVSETSAPILSCHATVNMDKACTAEMLGHYEQIELHQYAGCSVKQKREFKENFYAVCPAYDLLSESEQSVVFLLEMCAKGQTGEEQITTYIHKSDGKKRI